MLCSFLCRHKIEHKKVKDLSQRIDQDQSAASYVNKRDDDMKNKSDTCSEENDYPLTTLEIYLFTLYVLLHYTHA